MIRARSTAVLATALLALGLSTVTAVADPVPRQAPGAAAGAGAAAASAPTDPFYTYSGSRALSSYAPGAVLKTRTVPYHVAGIPLPLRAVQLVYRSTDQLGRPIAAVTSVLRPPVSVGTPKAVSYQSFYDSLDPEHGPSRAIAGDVSLGGLFPSAETALFAPFLLQGYAIVIPDTEGPDADFAAGPEYGTITLDSIRAASRSPQTGLSSTTRVGLVGYSGGAIATNWAAALAPAYAPDVNRRLVGAAEGGVLVAPAHNLRYISGTPLWGGVAGMAVIGVARAFDIDFDPYLTPEGRELLAGMDRASIGEVLGQYPDFTWQRLAKPRYANPNSVRPYVRAVNQLNLGSAASPTIPMMIRQGAGGELEGTPGTQPGIGRGDGVMVAGDVRTLARQYCADGTAVDFRQYEALSHVGGAAAWAPEAVAYLGARFAGLPVTSSCGSIPAGNSLAPERFVPPAS